MCCNYAPIAKECYVSLESYRADMARLREIFSGDIKYVHIAGGEPLLHPDLCEILAVTRQAHKYTQIRLITNGVKLLSMPDSFWEACRNNNVLIEQTKYPINLDFDKIVKKAELENVMFRFYGAVDKVKTTAFFPLDVTGQQNEKENFYKCGQGNRCIVLKDGRLYTCAFPASAHNFAEYFNVELYASESDSISIYDDVTKTDILNFLSRPIPFCRYCNIDNRAYNFEWGLSKKYISEWT